MKTVKNKVLKQCQLYAECALHDPELKNRLCAKVWAFSDIGILNLDEVLRYIDQIQDNAREAERRNEHNACN